MEFSASKGDDAWHFLKIDRKSNIHLPTRKGGLISRLTSKSILNVLPSLVYIPELSVVPIQVSWLRWTNSSFEWISPPWLDNTPQVPVATRENPWDFPVSENWGRIPLLCVQNNSRFPIKHVRSLDFLDWTPESPQEACNKTRRTLMSPQECKISRCTPNQIDIRPVSLALAP